MVEGQKPRSEITDPPVYVEDFLDDNKVEKDELDEKYQVVFLRALEVLGRLREKNKTNPHKKLNDFTIPDIQMVINKFLMHKLPVYLKNNQVDEVQKFEQALRQIDEWLDKVEDYDS